ncbi:hypothetical protein PORY_000092 [Pneumocystis oryctolagi]|uniref:Uncharacterized protein n=1 Tax=Pneumocystis oryctolagi TaxID=42067 RepID=A0ACB7CGH8_9ASCO|nr:hypothetical protein PORY_000092 [Pneumocystis oryctolagi]
MTDVWKSVGNYWCKYCKTFVRNDAFTRKKHEASDRHQGSLKRFLRDLDKKNEKEERERKATQKELDRIASVTGLSTRSFSTIPPKKTANTIQKSKPVIRKTVKESPIDIRATVGIPGPWEVVSTSEVKKDANKMPNVPVDTVANTSTPINISVEKPSLAVPRLKEDYEDLRSFRIEEKTLPSKTQSEQEETPAIFFKKRKPGVNKDIKK